MGVSIELSMAIILGCIGLAIAFFSQLLQKKNELLPGEWLPSKNNLAKREFEIYALGKSIYLNQTTQCAVLTITATTFLLNDS